MREWDQPAILPGTVEMTVPEAHEHDYTQAMGAWEHLIFCRKCGETMRLRNPVLPEITNVGSAYVTNVTGGTNA